MTIKTYDASKLSVSFNGRDVGSSPKFERGSIAEHDTIRFANSILQVARESLDTNGDLKIVIDGCLESVEYLLGCFYLRLSSDEDKAQLKEIVKKTLDDFTSGLMNNLK